MRTTYDHASVRLYHLDSEAGTVTTIMYGTLEAAMAEAARQPEELQGGLYIATDNDVVAWLDLLEG